MTLMDDDTRAECVLARIPTGRWGSPEDFKGAVLFLASKARSYGGWIGR